MWRRRHLDRRSYETPSLCRLLLLCPKDDHTRSWTGSASTPHCHRCHRSTASLLRTGPGDISGILVKACASTHLWPVDWPAVELLDCQSVIATGLRIMQCRQCGTDIADKALICYKCGAATTDPKVQPPRRVAPRSLAPFILAVIALIVAGIAVFLSRSSPSGTSQWATWVVAGVAIVIVALRAYARRR